MSIITLPRGWLRRTRLSNTPFSSSSAAASISSSQSSSSWLSTHQSSRPGFSSSSSADTTHSSSPSNSNSPTSTSNSNSNSYSTSRAPGQNTQPRQPAKNWKDTLPLSQGQAADPRNKHPQSVQSQAVRAGREARAHARACAEAAGAGAGAGQHDGYNGYDGIAEGNGKGSGAYDGMDAAALGAVRGSGRMGESMSGRPGHAQVQEEEEGRGRGNPEGIGMLDQVGSQNGSARFFDEGGRAGAGDEVIGNSRSRGHRANLEMAGKKAALSISTG